MNPAEMEREIHRLAIDLHVVPRRGCDGRWRFSALRTDAPENNEGLTADEELTWLYEMIYR